MTKSTEDLLNRLASLLSDSCYAADQPYSEAMDDARALRRISMTLHRWHELECGVDYGHIERDEKGVPWQYSYNGGKWRTPDREAGALKRLASIMARYPTLQSYVQTDPRGASLYILRPGDIPAGASVDSCYSRGIAVYK